MFGIGKAQKRKCYKEVKHLPCRYCAQRKSWMLAELFKD